MQNDLIFLQRLMDIKEKPGLWLGKVSLFGLDCWISGYLDALYALGQDAAALACFKKFNTYVMRRCGTERTTGNAFSSILETGYDDESGVGRFFELLDDFVREQAALPPRPEILTELAEDEARVFRIDRSKEQELVGDYLSEHCQELFGAQQRSPSETMVLQWDDGILTCILAGKKVNIERIRPVSAPGTTDGAPPVFTTGDEIAYTVIRQGEDRNE